MLKREEPLSLVNRELIQIDQLTTRGSETMELMAINTVTKAVHERIKSIIHQGKQVVLADFSNCSPAEVEKIARAVPDYVTAQPLGSVLMLVDFTGASFDQDALNAMKECAVFDKLHIKKATWIGGKNLPHAFEKDLKAFSRREFPTFKTREEALNWLVGD